MASLDDNPGPEKGTSFRVGSWTFVTDGSGSFKNCSIDQDPPEVSEVARHREFDEFIDQLAEIGFSDLNKDARIQRELDAIEAKTLSELEESLKKLLEDSKKETPTTILSNYTRVAKPSLQKKKLKD